ncbi:hypothetical protein EC973_006520 [Apophysomyces ossiformis]|uniref:Uncharacterized protein n=1 Tax=Apophysomyces ossiformis TaxID=679940 RepID=A0A8H7EQH0_9FUNG|nr:hypothetical protein EC973_006520 [Apophysomyces ossiformis]
MPVPEGLKRLQVQVIHEDPTVRREELICECEVDLTKVFREGEDDGYFQLLWQGRKAGEVYLELTFYASRPEGPQQQMVRPQHGHPPVNYRPVPPPINTQYGARPYPPQPITESMSTPIRMNANGTPGSYRPPPPHHQGQQHVHPHPRPPHPPPHHHPHQRPMPGPQQRPPPITPTHSVSADPPQRYPSMNRPATPPHADHVGPLHGAPAYPLHPPPSTSATPVNAPLLSAPFSPPVQRPAFNGYPPANPNRPHAPRPAPGQMSYAPEPQRFQPSGPPGPPGPGAPSAYRPYGNRPPPPPNGGYPQPSPHGGYPGPRPGFPPY